MDVFYVRDAAGNPVDMNTIKAICKRFGHTMKLNVEEKGSANAADPEANNGWTNISFLLRGIGGKKDNGQELQFVSDSRNVYQTIQKNSSCQKRKSNQPAGHNFQKV